jgi:ABC-type glycerol-3-phosphate transport system permease component
MSKLNILQELKVSPVEISYDMTNSKTWWKLGKFIATQLGVGIIVVIIIYFILLLSAYIGAGFKTKGKLDEFFGSLLGLMIGGIISFIVIIVGQMYTLSIYENWSGCYIKK